MSHRTSRPEDPFLFVPLLLPVVRTYYEYESYEYVKVCGMRDARLVFVPFNRLIGAGHIVIL